MISDCAQGLLTLVKTNTAFGLDIQRVGIAAGGKNVDPTMNNVRIPAAWIVYTGSENIEQNENCGPVVRLNFVVKIFLDYATEVDLLQNQYPILVNTINAVSGKAGPAGSKKWRFDGEAIDELTGNRIVYDQRYSIVAYL